MSLLKMERVKGTFHWLCCAVWALLTDTMQGLRAFLDVLNLNFNAFVYLVVAFYSVLITSKRLVLDLIDWGVSPSFYTNFQKRKTKM